MTRRSVRLASVAALAVLAFPLAACQVHQGTAAYVGDTRITDEQVDKYVDAFYAVPEQAAQAKGAEAAVRQRTLSLMIAHELFVHIAKDEGLPVSDSDKKALVSQFKSKPAQVPALLRLVPAEMAAELALVDRALSQAISASAGGDQAQAQKAYAAVVKRAADKYGVEVNPRFGEFDPAQLNMRQIADVGVRDLPLPQKSVPGGEGDQPQPQS